MSTDNISYVVTAPFAVRPVPPHFQVEAIAEIVTTRNRHIGAGDVVLIDPTQSPDDDQMVLVGNSIVAFSGQQHDGVVTGFISDAI
jgi:hypothetical protein